MLLPHLLLILLLLHRKDRRRRYNHNLLPLWRGTPSPHRIMLRRNRRLRLPPPARKRLKSIVHPSGISRRNRLLRHPPRSLWKALVRTSRMIRRPRLLPPRSPNVRHQLMVRRRLISLHRSVSLHRSRNLCLLMSQPSPRNRRKPPNRHRLMNRLSPKSRYTLTNQHKLSVRRVRIPQPARPGKKRRPPISPRSLHRRGLSPMSSSLPWLPPQQRKRLRQA